MATGTDNAPAPASSGVPDSSVAAPAATRGKATTPAAPAPTSTKLGQGQPIPTSSVRTGAAQAAPVAPAPLVHACTSLTSTTKVITEGAYTWDAGGEGVPASARAAEWSLYCGPQNWNVMPRSLQETIGGLRVFTPSISEHLGISASSAGGKRINVSFAEQTGGGTPYKFGLALDFNYGAKVPIDVNILTDVKLGPPAPVGQLRGTAVISHRSYRVYVDPKLKIYTLVPSGNQASGTIDVAPYVRYAMSQGWVSGSASLDHIAFVLEVYKAWGSQMFQVNRFGVSMN